MPRARLTLRRSMASIVMLGLCLSGVKGAYHPRLYGEAAVVKVVPRADRTPGAMAAHARRMVGPEVLAAALLDPRLSKLRRPPLVADPSWPVHALPVPQVHAYVASVEDGTIWVDSVSGRSAAEARSIASAIADAYVRDQGPGRVARCREVIPRSSQIAPKPLSRAWELAAAVALSVLASALVLVIPVVGPGDES